MREEYHQVANVLNAVIYFQGSLIGRTSSLDSLATDSGSWRSATTFTLVSWDITVREDRPHEDHRTTNRSLFLTDVPFLKNVRYMLSLVPIFFLFYIVTTISGWNLSVTLIEFYRLRV